MDTLLFRRGAFTNLQGRLDHTKGDEPYPLQRTRTLAQMRLIGDELPNGQLVSKSQDQIDAIEIAAIEKALDEHKRVAVILHGGNLDDFFRGADSLSARLLSSWKDPPPLPRKDAGIFPFWNSGVRNPYLWAIQNNASWQVFEITRSD
jgi:hypothetical protein